jgi:ribose 5-phosphate isomerase B
MRAVITVEDIPASGDLRIPADSIITPSARDLARDRGVRLVELPKGSQPDAAAAGKTIAIGSDHGGFRLKERLKPIFAELKLSVIDVGVMEEKPADYPDIAERVALRIVEGKAERGLIIDGAGIGSAMTANKIPGIRAALCYDRASARNSREHNNANVLTLGGRLLTESQAEEVLRTWLETPFAGGRHQTRVQKISEIEKRYAK